MNFIVPAQRHGDIRDSTPSPSGKWQMRQKGIEAVEEVVDKKPGMRSISIIILIIFVLDV